MRPKNNFYIWLSLLFLVITSVACTESEQEDQNRINLAGEWNFQVDSLDLGEDQKWFSKNLEGSINLPGSMTTNGLGDNITVNTPWTGSIFDSSYYKKDEYEKYRQEGNIKVPFWLQPEKYYKGAAWYQKQITIPSDWENQTLNLFIERAHWETSLWVDNEEIGMQNSLATPHSYKLPPLEPGEHTITIRVDNRVKDINVGLNSHSITDHTQTNWNGMVGELYLEAIPKINIARVKLRPDVDNKEVKVIVYINNSEGQNSEGTIEARVSSSNFEDEELPAISKNIEIQGELSKIELIYPMGDDPLLWDEFNPNLYSLKISLNSNKIFDTKEITFGMRKFKAEGKQFKVNGRKTFLRGTLESGIFPLTGYPSTKVEDWKSIFETCKSFGLNHVRFHSWCPPEAAFTAADAVGIYLQVESSSWANQGASIGDGEPVDEYIYEETEKIIDAYGNHPSFCMMAYGNEPAGKNRNEYLSEFVKYWKQKETHIEFTSGAGWPVLPENEFHVISEPRIQQWGQGLKSIINSEPPSTNFNWQDTIADFDKPVIGHEIGQWTVYPNFREMEKYEGVMKPKNFEIFQERLQENGLFHLADSLVLASGKLQVLCYKADIEAALRTPDFGGFQLLDLHDFPGQGTALVGVLDPFWEEKPYVTAQEYSSFNNSTVPLARFPKMIYLNNEELNVPVEIAHFGPEPLVNVIPSWKLERKDGSIYAEGNLAATDIPLGNAFALGNIKQSLTNIEQAENLKLSVAVNDFENSWDIWIYPSELEEINQEKFRITQKFDQNIQNFLNEGGKVLYTIPTSSLKPEMGGDIEIGFSSIFWNTAWTSGQAPHTLGVLVNPEHPAFKEFPTEYYSDWHWWDAMSHSSAMRLQALSPQIEPIVRVIDDWFTARSLGLIVECKVGKGKLLISSIDLLSDIENRPAARQLLYSLEKYMASDDFNPELEIGKSKIENLVSKS